MESYQRGFLKAIESVPPPLCLAPHLACCDRLSVVHIKQCHCLPQDQKVMLSLGHSAPSPPSTGKPGAARTTPPGSIQSMFNPPMPQVHTEEMWSCPPGLRGQRGEIPERENPNDMGGMR